MYIERLKRNCMLLDFPITHKGVFGFFNNTNIPSNSAESIKLSIEKNIPFEIDIMQTKDDIPIVYHDFTMSIQGDDIPVNSLTIDTLNHYKDKGIIDFVTLEECITTNNGTVPMVLDFKETCFFKMTKYRKNVVNMLKDYSAEYAIQSFNPFFIFTIGKKLPKALRGQLICRGKTIIDTFKMKKPKSIASLYEKLMSIICWLAKADYIGLEVSKSKKWNNKIEQFFFNTTDEVQNTVVEIASKVTKRPVIGWTLTDLSELDISPEIYDNYIFEPDKFENYELFKEKILLSLKSKNMLHN